MTDYSKYTRLSNEAHARLMRLVEIENSKRAALGPLASEVSAAQMASHIILNYAPANGHKEEAKDSSCQTATSSS